MGPDDVPFLPERLWWKVDQAGHAGGCWIWGGARDRQGYGKVAAKSITGRGTEFVHRLMFFHHGGVIADDELEVVDHICGNGHLGCVNPDHLQAITRADNTAKGRRHRVGRCDGCGAEVRALEFQDAVLRCGSCS